jgi:hypothetical protein
LFVDTGTLYVSGLSIDLELVWTERGGPGVKPLGGEGSFGSRLVNRSVLGQLGGTIAYDWSSDGVLITLKLNGKRLALLSSLPDFRRRPNPFPDGYRYAIRFRAGMRVSAALRNPQISHKVCVQNISARWRWRLGRERYSTTRTQVAAALGLLNKVLANPMSVDVTPEKTTVYVLRAPPESESTEAWLRDYGPKPKADAQLLQPRLVGAAKA